MRCVAALALFLFAAYAAEPQNLFIGRLLDATRNPPAPLPNVKVTLLATSQEALTNANGAFQFNLPKLLVPGTEIQIDVKAGNLRIYRPLNGFLTLPAPSAKPVEIQLLPAGSKLFQSPDVLESLLAQASKPRQESASPRKGLNDPQEREPRPQRFLKQWASDYGFSYDEVQRELKAWGDQIRANREKASVRQLALAEFQAQHFDKSAELFKESARDTGSELDSLQSARKELEKKERTLLRQFLDDEIRAAECLQNRFKFSEAVEELTAASKRVGRDRYPSLWAEMQKRSARALMDLGESGEPEKSIPSLRSAIESFELATQMYTRDALPLDWAKTQNDLGIAYQDLGERLATEEGVKSLRAAVAAYRNALSIYRKEAQPQDWAMTQNNLGNANGALGERLTGEEGLKSLRAAVSAHQDALQIYTKGTTPRDWAMTQNNLGNANGILGERLTGEEGLKSLRAAVSAHQDALQIYTKGTTPRDWASTQNDLGNDHLRLGERLSGEDGLKSVRAAINAHQAALQIYTKDALPQDWAMTQNNLGNDYQVLGGRLADEEGLKGLHDSVTAYQNALQVRTKDALPQFWADTQYNLALSYAALGNLADAATALESALSRYPDSLEYLTRAESIYHEELFRFDRAFELNARRVALGAGEDDFVEKYLTTARFSECASKSADRLAHRLAQTTDRSLHLVLSAIRLACLSAAPPPDDAHTALPPILSEIHELQKVNWNFAGTKHFIAQHPAFTVHSADWVRFFESLEEGDERKARAALTALGFHE